MSSIFDFEVQDATGKTISLSEYKGKKAYLIVNVASACGYTASNYQELTLIEEKYPDLQILAFPCNNFGNQEPGSNEEVCSFAQKHGAKFPILGKLPQERGDITTPLYMFLKEASNTSHEPISWNFAKFLVDAEGKVVKRFTPATSPNHIVPDIEKILSS